MRYTILIMNKSRMARHASGFVQLANEEDIICVGDEEYRVLRNKPHKKNSSTL